MTKSKRFELRVSEHEKAAWVEAAGGTARVSAWLRSLANAAADGGVMTTPCPREPHHRPGVYCSSCVRVN